MTPEQVAAHQRWKEKAVTIQLQGDERIQPELQKARQRNAKRLQDEKRSMNGFKALAGEAATSEPERGQALKRLKRGSGKPHLAEKAVLKACLEILEAHPKVALWWRNSTGAVKIGDRYLKFSFRGAADIMGMMEGGKLLAVECKSSSGNLSPDQAAFLGNVSRAGGYALVVRDPAYLATWLKNI